MSRDWLRAPGDPSVHVRMSEHDAVIDALRDTLTPAEREADFAYRRASADVHYLRWLQLIECRIDVQSGAIVCVPLADGAGTTLEQQLLPILLSVLLGARGEEVLHGSAVSDGERAWGVLGQPGAGKSALVASLVAAGYKHLTDDLLRLQTDGDLLHVLPGPARLKLFPRTAATLLGERASSMLNPRTKKRVYPLAERESENSAKPLAALLVLGPRTRAPSAHMRRIQGADAVRALIEHTFNTLDSDVDRQARLLRFAVNVAGRIPIFQVRIPAGYAGLSRHAADLIRRASQ